MKITWIMIIVSITVFAYTVLSGDAEKIFGLYGFSGSNLLARPYVLVTSIFLHASLIHLLSNVLVWVAFGLAVEDEMGTSKMLLVFFLGAFLGDFMSLFFYPFDAISIGASAGIFALVGMGMLVRPVDLSFYPLIIPLPLAFLGMMYALYNVYGFLLNIDPGVSYIGHFGGLVVGLIFGFKYGGIKKSLKIIFITLGIMVLIPLLWFLFLK